MFVTLKKYNEALNDAAFYKDLWEKRGEVIDFAAYERWVDEWRFHPGFDWAIIPDVIDGDEKDNNALLASWTLGNAGVPERRNIRVGIADDQFTEIVGGELEDGDPVVIRARDAKP